MPANGTTGPHQDSFYLPNAPALWTAWVPLVAIPMELGPLALLPGSHREGPRPHRHAFSGIEVGDQEPWATGPVAPGDVLLFGPHTVHCLADGRIMISMLGNEKLEGPGGFLLLD